MTATALEAPEGPRLIGLTGRARHGKNAVADILVKDFGFTQMSFAGPLKEMALRVDPVVGWLMDQGPIRLSAALALHDNDEDQIKEIYPEYRRFLQRLGTEGLRYLDDRFWIDLTMNQAMRLILAGERVVITDARFPNEIFAIACAATDIDPLQFGQVWRVDASRRIPVDESINHASETAALATTVDVTIDNNGTLGELTAQVHELMRGGSEWV